MTNEQIETWVRGRLQTVADACRWYEEESALMFGTEHEARPVRLLATSIYFALDTELAQLLADDTEERERG